MMTRSYLASFLGWDNRIFTVVERQAIDLVDSISYYSGDGASSTHAVDTGNRGVNCSHHERLMGLPLNPGECVACSCWRTR
jgi:hypothetical protein